jgi:hypothetical protein
LAPAAACVSCAKSKEGSRDPAEDVAAEDPCRSLREAAKSGAKVHGTL